MSQVLRRLAGRASMPASDGMLAAATDTGTLLAMLGIGMIELFAAAASAVVGALRYARCVIIAHVSKL